MPDRKKLLKRMIACLLVSGLLSEPAQGQDKYQPENQDKYQLEDFGMPLEKITSPPNLTWVNSGTTTVNPEYQTVMGVNNFYAPPLAAVGFNFSVNIETEGIRIPDKVNYGKGDVGLLYSRGIWYPHQIVREGTYHHLQNGQPVSFGVVSELVPLFGKPGFLEKITIHNRSGRPLEFRLNAVLKAGRPTNLPLENWNFSTPYSNQPDAQPTLPNTWTNPSVSIRLFQEQDRLLLKDGESGHLFFTVMMTKAGEEMPTAIDASRLRTASKQAWEERLVRLTKNVPLLKSNINGLEDYYKRSVLTGLVCVWENPDYALNPFPSESGMDGGATCLYPWGMAYAPNMTALLFDKHALTIAKKLGAMDLQRYYAYTLNGKGIGVKYSYDTYAYAVLCNTFFKYFGPQKDLFQEARRIITEDEQRPQKDFLIDFGNQHNMLEMRGAGWEHYVVSPNAERVTCLQALANMGKQVNYSEAAIEAWIKQADQIRYSLQRNLWDDSARWFASIYPNGYKDFVYSIQVFDALRAGICTKPMKEAILSHLTEGRFLSDYGVESISKEDKKHHEVIDSDWSGGGAYSGDGPQVALTLYEQQEPALGWEVLKRFFWMGKQLLYYPQEHLVDNPLIPGHKRSTVYAGLTGAEAILFGLAGFEPDYNGNLYIHPQLRVDGEVSIKGFGFRGAFFDIQFSKKQMKVVKNGKLFYQGAPKKIKVQG